MRKPVRIIGWIVLPIGIIALAVFLFLSYRQVRAKSQLVHRDALVVLEIKSDHILRELASNAIWNPRSYFGATQDTSERTELQNLRPWNLGLSLPANIYFFSTAAIQDAYFSILEVNDVNRLQQVLSLIGLQLDSQADPSTTWSATSPSKALSAVGNGNHVVLAWSPTAQDDLADTMRQYMNSMGDDHFIEIATLAKDKPAGATGDVVFWQPKKEDFWSINFHAGHIELAAHMNDQENRFSNKPQGVTFPDDNILSMRLHADIRPWLSKHQAILRHQGMSWEDIEPYLGNYWELQWKDDAVLQADTIISYDYDENFEMVEQRALQTETVPYLSLSFKASPHLMSYLPEKMFYKFYKQQSGQLLKLTTAEQDNRFAELTLQKDVFYLRYRQPEIWQAPLPLPWWFTKIEQIMVTGTREKEAFINFSGSIDFKNEDIHPIKQLLTR
ncbi:MULTISPECIES: hypothetical protein [Sphingobacterium]|uniref:Uncharacterized protein n=1 Tax=Sphingobacterium populi TaxID=1812824 RepID=A0ABW5UE09_9SPHI|nr:hypothetical protein [Sphingobacterium sp. CFCC 11742]